MCQCIEEAPTLDSVRARAHRVQRAEGSPSAATHRLLLYRDVLNAVAFKSHTAEKCAALACAALMAEPVNKNSRPMILVSLCGGPAHGSERLVGATVKMLVIPEYFGEPQHIYAIDHERRLALYQVPERTA